MRTSKHSGFSLVETLVASVLLALVASLILPPLAGFLRLAERQDRQGAAVLQAQRTAETLRAVWHERYFYDRNCLESALEPAIRLEVTPLDRQGLPAAPAGVVASHCPESAPPNPAALKRLTIRVEHEGETLVQLSLDLARPR